MSMMYEILSTDNAIVAYDSRISTTLQDGSKAIISDDGIKAITGKNFIMFFSGVYDICRLVVQELFKCNENFEVDLSSKNITEVLKKYHQLYIEFCQNNNLKMNKNSNGDIMSIGIALTISNNNQLELRKYMPDNDFDVEIVKPADKESKCTIVGVVDGFNPTPYEWCLVNKDNYGNNMLDFIRGLYEHCNDEQVGGTLTIMSIDRFGNVFQLLTERIPNSNNLRYYDAEHITKNCNHLIMNGNIQWNTNTNPLKVLYSKKAILTPTDSYNDYSNISSTEWHKTFESDDYYASYSYDGGSTWTESIKIKGEDGNNGSDGSDANVPGYIKSTYIDFSKIESPQIKGNFIMGGEIIGGKMIGSEFLNSSKTAKLILGDNNSNFGDLNLIRNDDNTSILQVYDNAIITDLKSRGETFMSTTGKKTYFYNDIDFSNANITGLTVTFG